MVSLLYILIKGAVCWYCFGVNLTACFITKCDAKCCDYEHQNGGSWIAMYNNVRAVVAFFLAYKVNIDW